MGKKGHQRWGLGEIRGGRRLFPIRRGLGVKHQGASLAPRQGSPGGGGREPRRLGSILGGCRNIPVHPVPRETSKEKEGREKKKRQEWSLSLGEGATGLTGARWGTGGLWAGVGGCRRDEAQGVLPSPSQHQPCFGVMGCDPKWPQHPSRPPSSH